MEVSTFDPFQREIHPQDPVLDEERVLTLARQHLSVVGRLTAIDESGGEARAYFIDDRYVFKTQRPQKLRASTSLKKEAFHLRQLERDAPEAHVPRVLGYGQAGGI